MLKHQTEDTVRILIVDDDDNILRQIAFILKSDTMNAVTAESGPTAMQLIREEPPFDLVVLDIMMPGMSGLEVCREIREKFNLFELPIIISSALTSAQDIASGLAAGANDYIKKPINRVELLARAKSLLSVKRLNDLARSNEDLARSRLLFDGLTGLPNREFLLRYLRNYSANIPGKDLVLAIVILNIDNFKSINNSLGYRIGDVFLQEIAEKIKRHITPKDTAIRLHTDTFAILIPEIANNPNRESFVENYVRTLLTLISAPVAIQQYEMSMTASAGIAFFPYEDRSAEDVIRFADTAMYFTKGSSLNSFTFYSNVLRKTESTRFLLEKKIKRALKQNEFILYYQPQINIADEQIVGVEALIRWEDPKEGIIFPGKFIPVAEDSGLIIDISEWVMERACQQAVDWQNKGLPPVRIGINLAPQHFHSSNLLPYIKQMLDKYRLDPRYLEMEITEGSIMVNIEETIAVLNQIRDLGLGLSVDDFGTGYSSLSYLKRFPIHTLKIDQSFISPMINKNPTEGAIVQSIIKLGHSLNLNVIAEGVETLEQLDYLKLHYCNEVQGFYYSRPVAVPVLTDMLGNRPLFSRSK